MDFFKNKPAYQEDSANDEVNSLIKLLNQWGSTSLFTSQKVQETNLLQAFSRLSALGPDALPALELVRSYIYSSGYRKNAIYVYFKILESINEDTLNNEVDWLIKQLDSALQDKNFELLICYSLMVDFFSKYPSSHKRLAFSTPLLLREVLKLKPKLLDDGTAVKCTAAIALFSLQEMSFDEALYYFNVYFKKYGGTSLEFPSRAFIISNTAFGSAKREKSL